MKLLVWLLCRNRTYAKFYCYAKSYGMSESKFLKAILADLLKHIL